MEFRSQDQQKNPESVTSDLNESVTSDLRNMDYFQVMYF